MSQNSNKIFIVRNITDLNSIGKGDDIVLCYGHFNIIHPGHIRFLQYARTLGKKLIVAVWGDRLVQENQRSKYFSQLERAEGVASIHFVDMVYILDKMTIDIFISNIKPAKFVLGKEFENTSRKDIKDAIASLDSYGGKIQYHAGEIHYASSELLHGSQQDIESERRHLFLQSCHRQGIEMSRLIDRVEQFPKAKILVIGDTIVDQYVACEAVGMSAEAPVLVVKEIESKEFVGGAGIVAAHLKALGTNAIFLSVIGDDSNAEIVQSELEKQGVGVYLIKDDSRPTTFKIRYMVENQKLFRVSRLKDHPISKIIEDRVIEKLRHLSEKISGILISDFVYGVITERVLEEIIKISQKKNILLFGDLQCSSQVGNVAKFKKFDVICPTEKEARIALSNQQDGIETIANMLFKETEAKNLVIKLGADGFISYSRDSLDNFIHKEHFPALVSNPVDVAGAGDSLLAALSASMCSGANLMESSAIGACMAALAVQTVGNIPVTYNKLQSFIKKLEKA
ncbi:MAG: PfkB family carbohydrate kinase [Leptospiraceae bacterium]|nr:adenylyltransferase/cytidyltransferase family protein [Leptospiraceae bacterium]MCK6382090.1 PfkB family carbohydrate kinase [Leptospiraceae bacterium]NUM41695.1 adenylyltransferase/cytidyltransferase family protein [Leptospiraceae bacterium]